MKHVVLMCLLLYIHTSQSEIFNRNVIEGADVYLYCNNEGNVSWSKDRDGDRFHILTARANEEIQKHNADPHNRYSVTGDLSLNIKKVSISDSGIYYCNKTPTVNLTVTSSDESNTTTSSYSQPGATKPPPAATSNSSSGNSSVIDFRSSKSTSHTQCSSTTEKPKTTTSTTRSQSGASTSSPAVLLEKPQTTTSTPRSQQGAFTPPSVSIKTAAAWSGAALFLVLILLLWACIKRKGLLAALAKKENIYETVDDNNPTAQPVPPQNTKDIIYNLAGDPDIVKLEQEQDVPLYSTIK